MCQIRVSSILVTIMTSNPDVDYIINWIRHGSRVSQPEIDSALHQHDINGNTMLHAAAYSGNLKIIQRCVEEDLDVNAAGNMCKNTPLHCATMTGQSLAVDMLLTSGANPNQVDRFNETPIDVAEKGGDLVVRNLLLAHLVHKRVMQFIQK